MNRVALGTADPENHPQTWFRDHLVCADFCLPALFIRNEDGYRVRLEPGGRCMQFGTFIGGGTRRTVSSQAATGLATDGSGNLYVAAQVNGPELVGTPCTLTVHPVGNTEPLILGLAFADSLVANRR